MVGCADPIAARPSRCAGCFRRREIHADKELEVFAVRIGVQVAKGRRDVGLSWIANVEGKSVKSKDWSNSCGKLG